MKYSKKGHYIREYRNIAQGRPIKVINKIKGTSECAIRYFTYYYITIAKYIKKPVWG